MPFGRDRGGADKVDEVHTSMAAPHINGVVALMREAKPNISVEAIKEIIYQTAYDLGDPGEDNDYGWGMVDAYEAVLYTSQPPDTPVIDGPARGKKGVSYNFTFNSLDPDGDDVYYLINWGDETSNETDYYPEGIAVEVFHTYEEEGDYAIKAKAKDFYGAESNWSEFEVTISRTKTTVYSLLHWFLERFSLLERLLSLIRVI